jgi:type IV pilus assembly protein PilA
LSLAKPFKSAVIENMLDTGALPTNAQVANWAAGGANPMPAVVTTNVTGIAIGANGAITISYDANVAPAGTNTLVMTPNNPFAANAANPGPITWVCPDPTSTLPVRIRPTVC